MNGTKRNLLPLRGDNIYPDVVFQFLFSYPFSSTLLVTRNLYFLKNTVVLEELETCMNSFQVASDTTLPLPINNTDYNTFPLCKINMKHVNILHSHFSINFGR